MSAVPRCRGRLRLVGPVAAVCGEIGDLEIRVGEACGRFWPHWWRELEPTVHRCRICRCTRFEAATIEQFHRWLA